MAELEMNDDVMQQYIVVRIGSEQYGIGIASVDNIIRMQKITRVPTAQYYFKGVINVRGEIIPVMSIHRRMELEESEITDKSRVVILRIEENGLLGIIVDEVSEVVTLTRDEIDPPNRDSRSTKDSFINGIGKNGGRLISLFDITTIVDQEEIA